MNKSFLAGKLPEDSRECTTHFLSSTDSFTSHFSEYLHCPPCRTHHNRRLPHLQLLSHWGDPVLLNIAGPRKPCAMPATDSILHLVSGSHSVHHLKSLSWSQTASGFLSSHSAVGKSLGFRSWKQSRDFPGSQANLELQQGMHGFQLTFNILSKGGFMWRESSCGQLDLMR